MSLDVIRSDVAHHDIVRDPDLDKQGGAIVAQTKRSRAVFGRKHLSLPDVGGANDFEGKRRLTA